LNTHSKAGHGNDRIWKVWKAKKPAFHPSHIPWKSLLGFPHSHGLDCGHVSKVNHKRKARKPDLRLFHRKGLVTDVPGPKCNERSSTLIPQQAWFPCISVKRRDCFFWVPASRGGRCPPGKARRDVWWKTATPAPTFSPATTSKRGLNCPSCQSCWVCPELRCSVIVSVDVTPHRFILIRSGMRIPSASVYQPPPAADAQNAKNDHQSDPLDRASYHDNPISTSFCEAEAAEFAVLSGPPVSLGSFLEPGPTSLLCGGDPCTACVTHPAALSGHDIKFRRFGAGCLAAPRCSDRSAWFALCMGEAGCISQECLRLLQS